MPSFITPQNGDDAVAEHVAQLTEDFQGLRNIPLSVTGINDAATYGLTIRNSGVGGKGLQVLDSAGAALLTVQDGGVTGATLTSPHMTAPVVDSGGLTVTAGNVGVGVAADPSTGLWVGGSITSGASQAGIYSSHTGSSAATTKVVGVQSAPRTAAVAFTATTVAGFLAQSPIKGAGSTITSAYGLLVEPITTGNTSNYGIDVGTPSGGSGDNLSIRASGAIRFSGLGARVAGDLYVIIDAAGNLHKSAIGPAS